MQNKTESAIKMSHSYKSEYPSGVQVDPEIVKFFETFYEISDTPGAHDQYVDLFEKDADFVLASKKAKGHDGMMCLLQHFGLLLTTEQTSQLRDTGCGRQ